MLVYFLVAKVWLRQYMLKFNKLISPKLLLQPDKRSNSDDLLLGAMESLRGPKLSQIDTLHSYK